MSTEDWIDRWLSRRKSLTEEIAWDEIEGWADEMDSISRWTQAAQTFKELKNVARAKQAYKAALRACSDGSRGMAYSNYANFLLGLGEFSEALPIFELAWETSKLPSIGLGLSSALLESYREREALEFLTSERESLGDLVGYWSNLSIAMTRVGVYEQAQQAAERALTMERTPETIFQWSLASLRLHGFTRADALEAFESRPNRPVFETGFGQELEDIAALEAQDRVVVVCEQGIGDLLQFIPFAAGLEARDCSVIIAGSPRLETLITSAFPSFHYVRSPVEAMKLRPRFWVPLLSLPKVIAAEEDFAPRGAYLKPVGLPSLDSQTDGKVKIGLAWKGNPNYPNDHLRSTRLESFQALLNEEKIQAYSLLLNIESDVSALPETKCELIGLDEDTDSSGTFVDTASLVAELDAVVTTDTSLAHLSGALGTKTYLLLNRGSDWRWGTPMRPMTWYSSLSIIWLDDDSGFQGGVERSLNAILMR